MSGAIKVEPDIDVDEVEVSPKHRSRVTSSACLFCLRRCPVDTLWFGSEVVGAVNCKTLQTHLQYMFVVRKLLDIPAEWCAATLEASGTDLNSWFQICTRCFEIVGEAWELFRNLLEIESHMKRIKERIKGKIVVSSREKRSSFVGTEVARKIRQHFVERRRESCGDYNDDTGVIATEDGDEDNYFITPDFYDDKAESEHDSCSPQDDSENSENDDGWDSDMSVEGRKAKQGSHSKKIVGIGSNASGSRPKRKRIRKDKRVKFPFRCEICPEKFKLGEDDSFNAHKKAHERAVEEGSKFVCSECRFPCFEEKELDDHKRERHRTRHPWHACKLCTFRTRAYYKLEAHVKEEHPGVPAEDCGVGKLECLPCNLKFISWRVFMVHKTKMHPGFRSKNPHADPPRPKRIRLDRGKFPLRCEICPEKFTLGEEEALKLHKEAHERSKQEGGKFDCPECKFPCFGAKEVEDHKREKHIKNHPWYACKLCDFKARAYYQLGTHVKEEHPGVPEEECGVESLECPLCNQKFATRSVFMVHKRKMHPELFGVSVETLECSECGEKFESEIRLQHHKNKHARDKKLSYFCEICGKGFQWNSRLERHMKTHSGSKEFVCHLCGCDFLVKRVLDNHYKKCHPELSGDPNDPNSTSNFSAKTEVKCRFCNLTSPFRSVILRHMETHKAEMGFQCDICSMSYTNVQGLNRHKRIKHSEFSQPVKCPHCSKPFSSKEYMIMHMNRFCKIKGLSEKQQHISQESINLSNNESSPVLLPAAQGDVKDFALKEESETRCNTTETGVQEETTDISIKFEPVH